MSSFCLAFTTPPFPSCSAGSIPHIFNVEVLSLVLRQLHFPIRFAVAYLTITSTQLTCPKGPPTLRASHTQHGKLSPQCRGEYHQGPEQRFSHSRHSVRSYAAAAHFRASFRENFFSASSHQRTGSCRLTTAKTAKIGEITMTTTAHHVLLSLWRFLLSFRFALFYMEGLDGNK